MPEIGEVARIVHFLRKHLVNRTIKSCQGFEDDIVYGKVGCSASAFQKAVEGKKVTGAGQQGKYFYVTFDSPPHSVMHLGMTGWVKFNVEETGYYKQAVKDSKTEEWPPKYMKFLLKCDAQKINGQNREPLEVAFIDARRLGRIRLVDCEAANIRKESPLKENGPDPVIDKDILTVDWLKQLLQRKKVPVKALLLDQGNISGVGNWVADEVLYQARLHPEQYSNTFDDDQVKRLHDSLITVCTTACELLADSDRFPENWLMKYRWNKGKKDSNTLPNGEKIAHLTVGGRTSAIVPSVQKKTAAVAGDVDPKELKEAQEDSSSKGRKRKVKAEDEAAGGADNTSHDKPVQKGGSKRAKTESEGKPVGTKGKRASTGRNAKAKGDGNVNGEVNGEDKAPKNPASASKTKGKPASKAVKPEKPATPSSRRSSRTKAR